eukprot:5278697-Amphidinium_carterae.1
MNFATRYQNEAIGAAVTILRKPETHAMSLAMAVGRCESTQCYRHYARALSLTPLVQLLTYNDFRTYNMGSRYGYEKLVNESSHMGSMDLRNGLHIPVSYTHLTLPTILLV